MSAASTSSSPGASSDSQASCHFLVDAQMRPGNRNAHFGAQSAGEDLGPEFVGILVVDTFPEPARGVGQPFHAPSTETAVLLGTIPFGVFLERPIRLVQDDLPGQESGFGGHGNDPRSKVGRGEGMPSSIPDPSKGTATDGILGIPVQKCRTHPGLAGQAWGPTDRASRAGAPVRSSSSEDAARRGSADGVVFR